MLTPLEVEGTIGAAGDGEIIRKTFYRVKVLRVDVVEKDATEYFREEGAEKGEYRPTGKRCLLEDEKYTPLYVCEMDDLPKFMRI